MLEQQAPTVPQNEVEVDALLESIESPAVEAQGEEQSVEQAPAEQPKPEEKPDEEPQYAIKWKGKEITVPLSKLKTYAQQAYDYSQRMQELKTQQNLFEQQKTSFEQQYKETQDRLKQFEQVDAYARENPAWWDHVQSQWTTRTDENGTQVVNPVVEQLNQQVAELKAQVEGLSSHHKASQHAQADIELEDKISGYKNEHSDLDWNSVDENGLDLERRVLQFAIDNNIGSFEAAANHMLMPEILKRTELRAKEQVAKEAKKQARLGLGPITDKPSTKLKKAEAVRDKSYDELAEDGLAEFGII